MKVYFVINESKPQAWEVAIEAALVLKWEGVRCITAQALPNEEAGKVFEVQKDELFAIKECDAVITVGGDGTLLHAVARFHADCPPVLGINVGRMGFLATIEPTELLRLKRLARGDYLLDERSLLEGELSGEKRCVFTALNDIVIGKSAVNETIHCTVYCDGTLVSSYRGDGVIVATPTGSTAYSLSAGGPILDAKSNCMVVTAISAHSINTPPMVFAAERQLRIEITENFKRTACLSFDGTDTVRLGETDVIHVRQSPKKVRLICFSEADQLKTIDKKLKGR